MRLTKTFIITIGPTTEDMPLDQAVYVPTVGARAAFIAAVRGGYAFRFDPSTGTKLSSSRYTVPTFSDASIAYDSVNDKLWVAFWDDPTPGSTAQSAGQRLYRIAPSVFGITTAVEATLNLLTDFTGGGGDSYGSPLSGPHEVIYRSGLLYGWGLSDSHNSFPFRYSIGGATGIANVGLFTGSSGTYGGVELNGTELWMTATNGEAILIFNATTMAQGASISLGAEVVKDPWGICVYPTNGQAYVTTRTGALKRIKQDHTILADLALGGTTPTPFRCRFNSADSLIYVPMYKDNTVVVVDPAASAGTGAVASVSPITGFDSPFDCVFTPTKKWAVQRGAVGLREILFP